MKVSGLTALILAGGRGSRSADPTVPKILQTIQGDKSILEFHLEFLRHSGVKKVVFLLGFLAEDIVRKMNACRSLYPGLEIDYEIEQSQEGNFPPVFEALKRHKLDDVVIILGDVLTNFPLMQSWQKWKQGDKALGVLVHPNLHPDDSESFSFASPDLIQSFHNRGDIESKDLRSPKFAIAGAYFLNAKKLPDSIRNRTTTDLRDISKDLVPLLLKSGNLEAIRTIGFFSDTGTANRLERTKHLVTKGAFSKRGQFNPPAVFLDRDGTLIPDLGTARKNISENEVAMKIQNSLRELNELGIPIFLVTNQPGISKGEILFEDVDRTHYEIQLLLASNGAFIDDFVFCPHHPDSGFEGEIQNLKIPCKCRKPETALIDLLQKRYSLDLRRSIVIGDSQADQNLASRIKATFFRVDSSNLEVSCSEQLNKASTMLKSIC